jgi:prephenate dehydrogenase
MPGHEGKEYVQIWVDIDDRPGMIATAANIFAEAGINIRNISIQDSREYEGGSLRVTVLSVKDAEIGADLLRDIGLSVRVVR